MIKKKGFFFGKRQLILCSQKKIKKQRIHTVGNIVETDAIDIPIPICT